MAARISGCNRGYVVSRVALRCLIVDDNAGFRDEVRALLQEQGIDVVGTAASGSEALGQVARLAPDVALVDIDLRGESGLDLARELGGRGNGRPTVTVILISTHDESEYADLIAGSPAVGFIAKTALSAPAIHEVLRSSKADGRRR
jgi:DNA-binding NarL/FixJ family response regulator